MKKEIDFPDTRKEVTLEDSSGYFLRVVSLAELEAITSGKAEPEVRWFMMPDLRIPPQAFNWMVHKGGPYPYDRALLLTPDVVERCGIEIEGPDGPSMDRWYPAVRLANVNRLQSQDLKDATHLLLQIADLLGADSGPLEIMQVIEAHKPTIDDLFSCAALVLET
jgi:hypothetical protein